VSVSAIVPTLGRSPYLLDCLRALRREGGEALEIVVVDQGEAPVDLPPELGVRVLREGSNQGFAIANNRGIAAASGELVAAVNDDALVMEGWLAPLEAALRADPRLAAVQGVNLVLGEEPRLDGCGIAWNRWWQAVQVKRGEEAPGTGHPPFEIYGASATAALYRRSALARVSPEGAVFDPQLVTYYEDVDLAIRLRAAGFGALCVPAARARHAGSFTSLTLGRARWALLYGNRWLIVARLLGRGFWLRLPLLLLRDLLDLGRALAERALSRAGGILAGWGRALRLLSRYAHGGKGFQ
jgi:GT2 family glycosyltransferase